MKAILEINRIRVSWLTEWIENISEDTLSPYPISNQQFQRVRTYDERTERYRMERVRARLARCSQKGQ